MDTDKMLKKQADRRTFLTRALLTACVTHSVFGSTAAAQQNLDKSEVQPTGYWSDYRQIRYVGKPIHLHIRVGHERLVLMPEPVRLQDSDLQLPGCEMIMRNDTVTFYPTTSFNHHSVLFVGTLSGVVYELLIRASSTGIRQPIQINR